MTQNIRGGVEDTRLEAKAKDTKKFRGQGQKQPFQGQTLSRPRTGMLEAKAKEQGHRRKCTQNKIFFRRSPKKRTSKTFLLVLELRSRGFYVQAYADDLSVLVLGDDMLWIRGMAQKAISIAANWAAVQELQFSSKKTEIVLFTHKRNPHLGSLSMNDSKLELSKEARLLGVTLNSKLTWKPHITRITHKETTALLQCRLIVGKTWRIKPSLLKRICTGMIRRIMYYACVSWASGLNKMYLVMKLTKMQRLACLMISSDFLGTLLVVWKYCSTLLPLRISYWLRQSEGHTGSLLVDSGMPTELVPFEKRNAMVMFAMRLENSYLCCKCQLTE